MRSFYLLMAVIGTIVPWIFFAGFFSANGLDVPGFVGGLFVNGAAGGISADVILSSAVFWTWSRGDALTKGVGNWWILIPATLLVGLSLSLPLYLWMREGAMQTTVAKARIA